MHLPHLTPVVLTYNEEANIARCLQQLTWAAQVIIVDSGSTDRTLEIIATFPNAKVLTRPFDNHTAQWNYGCQHAATDWILSLDADYILTPELIAELTASQPPADLAAYYISFVYCLNGSPLRGTLYPPRAALFQKARCTYIPDGHTQLLQVNGPHASLTHKILHDDRKSLRRWLTSQQNYAALEAAHLCEPATGPTGLADRLRLMIWPAAPAAFFFTLLGKGLIFDGWPGLYYSLQRTYAELLLSLELLDRKVMR